MSLKAKVEAIIYAAEEPVTLEQISMLLKDVVLADLASARENAAIERADLIAENAAETSGANAADSAAESEELPELASESLASESEDLPEPGPLMPESATSDARSSDEAEEEEQAATPEPEEAQNNTQPEIQAEAQTYDPREDTSAQEPVTESPEPDTDVAADSAAVAAPETAARKRQPRKSDQEIADDKAVRTRVREILVELITDYTNEDRGMEIRQVAGGFRMATKPEHHDVVRAFAKSLKPPIRLSLAALETLAVIAYKQPVTAPEIAEIRGVESASVLGTLLDRKLITTAGRKQVIGRPMLYKTSKDFLLRFGLNNVNELPSMEEFSQLASDGTIEITPSEPRETTSLFEPEFQPDLPLADLETRPQTPDPQPPDSAQPDARQQRPAEPVDSHPHSEPESGNGPETEHPIGRQQ
jgi:segregation and condensation protein B